MMNKISVFGSTGFIGSRFCELFSDNVISIPRDNIFAPTSSLLWFISTTNNYHIFDNVQLDIDTNLSLMVEALDKQRKIYGKELVFNLISTWFVYGDPAMLPVREDSVVLQKDFIVSLLVQENN